jgi:hypothetical protein
MIRKTKEAVRYEGTLREAYHNVPGQLAETSVTFPLNTNLEAIHSYIYHGTQAWYDWVGPKFV